MVLATGRRREAACEVSTAPVLALTNAQARASNLGGLASANAGAGRTSASSIASRDDAEG